MKLKPLFTQAFINKVFSQFESNAEDKFLEVLSYAGNMAVRIARESGNYKDHTGNLRSSIGYVVVRDGKVIESLFKEADKGTDRKSGVAAARGLATQVARTHNKGYVLIVVAGMEYAAYVESLKNYDVLQSSVYATSDFLKKTLEDLTNGRS